MEEIVCGILFGFQQGYDTSGYAFIVRKGFIHSLSSIDRGKLSSRKSMRKYVKTISKAKQVTKILFLMGSNVISGSAEGIIVSVWK